MIRSGSAVNITGAQIIALTWNANEIGTPNGSLVECRVYGTAVGGAPGARCTVEVGAIEWNCEYTAGATYKDFAGTSTLATTTPNASLNKYSNYAGVSALASTTPNATVNKYSNFAGVAALITSIIDANVNRYGNFTGISALVTDIMDANINRYGNFTGLIALLSTIPDAVLDLIGGGDPITDAGHWPGTYWGKDYWPGLYWPAGAGGAPRPYCLYPGDMVLGRIIKILPYRIKKKK